MTTTEEMITVTVCDGKYTMRQTASGKWEALRYGEEWPAFRDSGPDNLHVALAYEVAALREQIAAASDLLPVVKEYVTEDWSHMDDEELAHELSLGNEMVRNHIAARAAIKKAGGHL